MPNPEMHPQDRVSEIVAGSSRLDETSVSYLQKLTRSRLDRLGGVLIDAVGVNPMLHFTTTSFIFNPDTDQDRAVFLRSAGLTGWRVDDSDRKLKVSTGNAQSILDNGLKEGTCVATIPSGESEALVASHPRLALDAFRNAVYSFGKHSLPYKQTPVQKTNGLLENVNAALIIANGEIPARAKGVVVERVGLTRTNLLKPSTHIIIEGAAPSDILAAVPFRLSEPVLSRRGNIRPNARSLVEDVYRGVRESIRNNSLGNANDQSLLMSRYVAMLNCFKPVSGVS